MYRFRCIFHERRAYHGRATVLNLWPLPSGLAPELSLAGGPADCPPASGVCCTPLSRAARGPAGDEGGITPACVGRTACDGLGAAGLYSRHSPGVSRYRRHPPVSRNGGPAGVSVPAGAGRPAPAAGGGAPRRGPPGRGRVAARALAVGAGGPAPACHAE